MIKFRFKIIVEKGKTRKTVRLFKGLSDKVTSNLGAILSVIVLSIFIGLGIHLVFAGYTSPNYESPLGNSFAPINIGSDNQIKQGNLKAKEVFQKDNAWKLYADGGAYFDVGLEGAAAVSGNNVVAYNYMETKDMVVDGHIHAPNQGWEGKKNAVLTRDYGDAKRIACENGWYLKYVYVWRVGNSVDLVGECASPFKKYTPPPPPNFPPVCFTGKTPILMADATYKNIADVQLGEYILTRESETSSKLVPAKILDKYEHWVNNHLVINNSLEVTHEHKMFVNGKWKLAGDIKIGDKLLNKDNQEVVVESIESITKELEFQVYNLEIEKYQTYFAGEFYVHNLKDRDPPVR